MKEKILNWLEAVEIRDKPKQCTIAEYEKAGEEYISLIKPEKNDIIAIYQIGDVGVAGLSDIDYIIVFKNKLKDNINKYSISKLSEKSKYLFSHDPFFMDEKALKNINYWFPVFNIKHIYGKLIEVEESNLMHRHLLLNTNMLITKIPSDLLTYSNYKNKLFARTQISMINSLKHTIKLFKNLEIIKSELYVDFIQSFDSFRTNWFINTNYNNLKHFISKAVIISSELHQILSNFLKDNLKISCNLKSFTYSVYDKTLIFDSNWNAENSLDHAMSLTNKTFTYPIELGFYLYLWANSKSKMGKQIKKKLPDELVFKIDDELTDDFNKISAEIEHYNDFSLAKFNIPASPYFTLWTNYSINRLINSFNYHIFIPLLKRIKK